MERGIESAFVLFGNANRGDLIDQPEHSVGESERVKSGSGHGWAAANTMFWNCDAKCIVVMDPETAGENNFAIGYRAFLSKTTPDFVGR